MAKAAMAHTPANRIAVRTANAATGYEIVVREIAVQEISVPHIFAIQTGGVNAVGCALL